jgi:hypothetical protein
MRYGLATRSRAVVACGTGAGDDFCVAKRSGGP